jgi:E3 ubiquitin-protein ligase UBR7
MTGKRPSSLTVEELQDEHEPVYTVEELQQKFAQEEAEVNEKLHEDWGDEQRCTYPDGYISQNVYACATCQTQGDRVMGFCYGCSMNCHLNHDVFELFKKRDFCCDCGISCSASCTLFLKENLPENSKNQYNHNFQGKYCWCDKP